ncbi:MAG: type VII secretion protein EccB [Pseudoclavibacter sp.]|nr:type VII secretion protein EccB [Pseudoclavibacter sp.]
MATSKDILDAQRFNKRRLISVFTSGTPGGREIELRSPVGPLVVGVVLTVIILVGAWLFGRFSPALPQNWQTGMLVVDSDSGARYYSIDGTLHPIRNAVSAQLLAEGPQLPRATVGGSALVGIPRGPEIGIEGAPDGLPAPERLRNTGWVACPAADSGTFVAIGGADPGDTGADGGLVQLGDQSYLVAEGRRYPIAEEDLATVRIAFGWESAAVTEVEPAWADLFDLGSPLTPWSLDGAGAPVNGFLGPLAGVRTGTMVEVPDGQQIRTYLVVADGTIAPMSPVATQLYLVGGGAKAGNPIRASLADIAELTVKTDPVHTGDWPEAIPTMNDPRLVPCAQLSESGGRTSSAVIQAVAPETAGVVVSGGSGALVRATSGGDLGALFVVADTGVAFGLGGPEQDVVQRLGYLPEQVSNVPAAWIRALPAGPTLSTEAAWATVPLPGG